MTLENSLEPFVNVEQLYFFRYISFTTCKYFFQYKFFLINKCTSMLILNVYLYVAGAIDFFEVI